MAMAKSTTVASPSRKKAMAGWAWGARRFMGKRPMAMHAPHASRPAVIPHYVPHAIQAQAQADDKGSEDQSAHDQPAVEEASQARDALWCRLYHGAFRPSIAVRPQCPLPPDLRRQHQL